jgi:uncharacterized membrane protein YtjA (UPF0391 family)
VTSDIQKNLVFLLLAGMSALMGFGDMVAGNAAFNPALLLPECLDGIVIGLSRIMAVMFALLFVVSACFGRYFDA